MVKINPVHSLPVLGGTLGYSFQQRKIVQLEYLISQTSLGLGSGLGARGDQGLFALKNR